jgi:hypothetical protein
MQLPVILSSKQANEGYGIYSRPLVTGLRVYSVLPEHQVCLLQYASQMCE